MQKYIVAIHQAMAEFSMQNFSKTIDLLWQGWKGIVVKNLVVDKAMYNALCDGVAILEVLLHQLPIFEYNAYAKKTITSLNAVLYGNQKIILEEVEGLVDSFKHLLFGIHSGVQFFEAHRYNIATPDPLVSIEWTEKGELQLHQRHDNRIVEVITDDFYAYFKEKRNHPAVFYQAIEQAKEQNDTPKVIELLHELMTKFPKKQKECFLQIADLYFEAEAYREATDAYMKSIVLGVPKEEVVEKVRTACNTLAREAATSKEANRWRELLINFF